MALAGLATGGTGVDDAPAAVATGLDVVPSVVAAVHDHGAAGALQAAQALERPDLFVFGLVGLLAGAHCLGMCGPLVTTYGDRMRRARPGHNRDELTPFEVRQHLLFNLGRTVGYTLVGALFGLLGALAFVSVDAAAAVGTQVRGVVGVLVGVAILASGLYYLRGQTGGGHDIPVLGRAFGAVSRVLVSRIDRLATSPGILGLGAIHGLLPCPIIYPAYLYAFAVGDPVRGALSLAALGVGTIPTLFFYGTLLGSISARRRRVLHRGLGAAFLVLGYVPLQHGLMSFGIHLPHLPIPFYQPL